MEKIKAFQLRIPYNLWKYLKLEAAQKDKSLNRVIRNVLEKHHEEARK